MVTAHRLRPPCVRAWLSRIDKDSIHIEVKVGTSEVSWGHLAFPTKPVLPAFIDVGSAADRVCHITSAVSTQGG
jgi:hypothetical protein